MDENNGRLLSDSTWTYKIPTAACIPRQLNVEFLKVRSPAAAVHWLFHEHLCHVWSISVRVTSHVHSLPRAQATLCLCVVGAKHSMLPSICDNQPCHAAPLPPTIPSHAMCGLPEPFQHLHMPIRLWTVTVPPAAVRACTAPLVAPHAHTSPPLSVLPNSTQIPR